MGQFTVDGEHLCSITIQNRWMFIKGQIGSVDNADSLNNADRLENLV